MQKRIKIVHFYPFNIQKIFWNVSFGNSACHQICINAIIMHQYRLLLKK